MIAAPLGPLSGLGLELLGGLALATLLAWPASRLRLGVFLLLVFGLGVAFLPALAVVLLGSDWHGGLALALMLLPGLAASLRRVDRAGWDAARRLGVSRALVLRFVVLPLVAPALIASLVGGGLVLGAKARLERKPETIRIDEPAIGIG